MGPRSKKIFRGIKTIVIGTLIGGVSIGGYQFYNNYMRENEVLKKVIERLQADTRVAEVLVTGVNYDEESHKRLTTIKFLEYDVSGQALPARYFTFEGNIIQFQSFVIRFDDLHVRNATKLKDKSAYLFWKVFMLDGKNTQEYEINKIYEIPTGYRIADTQDSYEKKFWEEFWKAALDPNKSSAYGIKNAQIEAPGSLFVPGILYTIKIEHDGGLRIDTSELPAILKGEKIPS